MAKKERYEIKHRISIGGDEMLGWLEDHDVIDFTKGNKITDIVLHSLLDEIEIEITEVKSNA